VPALSQILEPEQVVPIASSAQVTVMQVPTEQYLQAPAQVFEPTVSSVLLISVQFPEPSHCLQAAVQFLPSWPEATSWHEVLLPLQR
jgi:hypothetical protein